MKRAGSASWKGEAFFRKLVETSGAVPYSRDYRTNTYDHMGEGIEAITGYSSSTITPDVFESIVQEIIPLGRFAGLPADEALERARNTPGVTSRADHRIIARSGEERWVEISTVYERTESGRAERSIGLIRDITERKHQEQEREKRINELKEALALVDTLHGILPICAKCKKIRDGSGDWHEVEEYVRDHSEADFSHGICPACAQELYEEMDGEPREGTEP